MQSEPRCSCRSCENGRSKQTFVITCRLRKTSFVNVLSHTPKPEVRNSEYRRRLIHLGNPLFILLPFTLAQWNA